MVPGRSFRSDFVIDEKGLKVAFELDGWTDHSRVDNFKRDRQKDRIVYLQGFSTFRFSAREAIDNFYQTKDELEQIKQKLLG